MSKKHRTEGGIIYSTNPDQPLSIKSEEQPISTPLRQNLRVSLDKKQRAGKSVTLITGYQGNPQDLDKLARMLKSKCGVGGAVKDGLIIIQGDFRDKILDLLLIEGFSAKRLG